MDPHYDGDKPAKRNLPSWMGSKENANKSHGKKRASDSHESTGRIAHSGETVSDETTHKRLPFSKLLEGVVFALSGFVNPERSTLRSQALEMGAEYRPDWSSDCTLLVCAFPNTPKFRQVESDCGTIVSKEWISECYIHKKLVDIDCYLMHAGRPWRKNKKHYEAHQDESNAQSLQPREQVERKSRAKPSESAMSKVGRSNDVKDHFSPSKVKEWATNDLNKTVLWLESQEEKPEPDEVRMIAVEGIITCLKDAIESLRQNQDIRHVTEQWMFVPHVVKELAELEGGNRKGLISKEELCELAITCKMLYESKFVDLNSSPVKSKKQKTGSAEEVNKGTKAMLEDEASDSDKTIEMTEEEIEIACKELSSELSSCQCTCLISCDST